MSDLSSLVFVLVDVRSCYNVGSIARTAECLGVRKIFCVGITPYPEIEGDTRTRKHIDSNNKEISKTALGSEKTIEFIPIKTLEDVSKELKTLDYKLIGFESVENTATISEWNPLEKTAIVLGSEVDGISLKDLSILDQVIKIDMFGSKESLNVSVVAGIAGYFYRYKRGELNING